MEFHLDQSILRGDPGRVSTGRLTAPLPTPCTRSTFLFVPATSTGAWSSEERNVPSTPAPCDVHGSLGALSSAAASDWSNLAGRGLSPPFAAMAFDVQFMPCQAMPLSLSTLSAVHQKILRISAQLLSVLLWFQGHLPSASSARLQDAPACLGA